MVRVAAALVPVGGAVDVGDAEAALQLRMHYGPRYRCRCRCCCVAVLVATPRDDVLSSARMQVGAAWAG